MKDEPTPNKAPSSTPGRRASLRSLDTSPLDIPFELEEVLSPASIGEVCQNVFRLFGIPVYVVSGPGNVYGGPGLSHEVSQLVNVEQGNKVAVGAEFDQARRAHDPQHRGEWGASPRDDAAPVTHRSRDGLLYDISPLRYEQRILGHIVLGPYASSGDAHAAPEPAADVPRAKPNTIRRIVTHIETTLEILVFHGHKAALTSSAHVFSTQESYRALTEKTERLQDAYDRLKELDRLKSNFLATVSHELRTPLTSILGYGEMLQEGFAGPLNPEQREYVDTVVSKGESLLAMIGSLLDLSRLEMGELRLRREHLTISPILEEVRSTFLPLAQKQNAVLEVHDQGGSVTLWADSLRLRQVLSNLVDNALKFTPDAGRVVVQAAAVSEGADEDDLGFALLAPASSALELRVLDSGPGIAEEERQRIFDAFYQVEGAAARKGSGLGLAIVKRIVEAHGGSIRVEANQPSGTCIVVRLPAAGGHEQGAP